MKTITELRKEEFRTRKALPYLDYLKGVRTPETIEARDRAEAASKALEDASQYL